MNIDTSELDALRADLLNEGSTIGRKVHAVMKKAAVNIKQEWRSNAAASSGRHAAGYPSTITFDERSEQEIIIGPEKRGQGNLGAILEYGSVHNPPHNDGKRAADKEEPNLEREIEKLTEKFLQ